MVTAYSTGTNKIAEHSKKICVRHMECEICEELRGAGFNNLSNDWTYKVIPLAGILSIFFSH